MGRVGYVAREMTVIKENETVKPKTINGYKIPLHFALGLAATRLGSVDLDEAWDGRHWDGPCFHSPHRATAAYRHSLTKFKSNQQWLRPSA